MSSTVETRVFGTNERIKRKRRHACVQHMHFTKTAREKVKGGIFKRWLHGVFYKMKGGWRVWQGRGKDGVPMEEERGGGRKYEKRRGRRRLARRGRRERTTCRNVWWHGHDGP
jgi:hypothetical protein